MSAGDITHQVDPEKMNNINVYKYKTDLEWTSVCQKSFSHLFLGQFQMRFNN